LRSLVAGVLDNLGNNASAVAAALRERQVQGVRYAVRMLNPVVRYVGNEVSTTRRLDVIQGDRLRLTLPGDKVEEVTLPEAVQAFLAGFNRGDYPELEMPSPG
jgi:hypothetical protein